MILHWKKLGILPQITNHKSQITNHKSQMCYRGDMTLSGSKRPRVYGYGRRPGGWERKGEEGKRGGITNTANDYIYLSLLEPVGLDENANSHPSNSQNSILNEPKVLFGNSRIELTLLQLMNIIAC